MTTRTATKPSKPSETSASKYVDVEATSNASTTLYVGNKSIDFVDGKATVDAETASILREKKHVK